MYSHLYYCLANVFFLAVGNMCETAHRVSETAGLSKLVAFIKLPKEDVVMQRSANIF